MMKNKYDYSLLYFPGYKLHFLSRNKLEIFDMRLTYAADVRKARRYVDFTHACTRV